MKNPLILIASLFAAACSTVAPPDDAAEHSVTYSALGTEPFWSLKIDRGEMRFSSADGADVRSGPFDVRRSINGWRYTSKSMTVEIVFTECSDGMSEWVYKDSVKIRVSDREYQGCGGGILPPQQFDGTAWRIVSINGDPIGREREAMVNFAGGRMSGGVGGCNRLNADYVFADRKLSFGTVISTRMACPDPIAKQEYVFVTLLRTLASTAFPGDGTMVLTGQDGSTVVLKQSI